MRTNENERNYRLLHEAEDHPSINASSTDVIPEKTTAVTAIPLRDEGRGGGRCCGCWSEYGYYGRSALREVKQRRFTFCLGASSCLFVVIIAAICSSLLRSTPVVFLQQAEADSGQYDIRIQPVRAPFINHTMLARTLQQAPTSGKSDPFGYHSPRSEFSVIIYGKSCADKAKSMQLDLFDAAWKFQGATATSADHNSNNSQGQTPSEAAAAAASFAKICPPKTNDSFPNINSTNRTVFMLGESADILQEGDPPPPSNSTGGNTDSDGPSLPKPKLAIDERFCLDNLCEDSPTYPGVVTLIDTAREKRMGFGRSWQYEPLEKGEALISPDIAKKLNISDGDTFFVKIGLLSLLPSLVAQKKDSFTASLPVVLFNELLQALTRPRNTDILVAIRCKDILQQNGGKFADEAKGIFVMEFAHFVQTVAENLNPTLSSLPLTSGLSNTAGELIAHAIKSASLYENADKVFVNIPPPRVEAFFQSDYSVVQDFMLQFASKLIYFAGFPEISTSMPVLDALRGYRFFSLYLGLLLSVILTILFALSTMLIYSLLMISVETRTFELGVHRMVGMNRSRIVKMMLVQASSYSIVPWAVGLIIAQIALIPLMKYLSSTIGAPLSSSLTSSSILLASMLGLGIPLIAAILPIRKALNQNIHDSLDTQHSKTVAVKFSIERSEDSSVNVAWLAAGTCISVFGFLIYYLLPLSLITFNLELFFNIFFGILTGMLFGLILLSLNFEHILERIIVTIFLFWVTPSIKTLILKNLVAHRSRNRKTTIMYALSLGFILFITVAYALEIKTAAFRVEKSRGSRLVVQSAQGDSTKGFDYKASNDIETLLVSNPSVDSFAWMSRSLDDDAHTYSSIQAANLGRTSFHAMFVRAVSPNFFDVTMSNEFLIPRMVNASTSLSLAEQIYTVSGSQKTLTSSNLQSSIGLRTLDDSFILAMLRPKNGTKFSYLSYFKIRPLALLDSAPVLSVTQFTTNSRQDAIVSFPALVRMSKGKYNSISDVPLDACFIKMKENATNQDLDQLIDGLSKKGASKGSILDYRDSSKQLERGDRVMGIIFGVATYLAMFLCMFSLMASMFTNIYEQTKEIAILRSIGLKARQIVWLYVYEAFTLVMAASLLGVMIGSVLAWTMSQQRVLFTQLPVAMSFPTMLLLVIFLAAVFCALISSYIPANTLLKRNISQIMRTVI